MVSGKTTLLKIVANILEPDQGRYFLEWQKYKKKSL